MNVSFKQLSTRFAVFCTAASLVGCASLQPKTPEQEVEALANQRWQYLVEGKFDKAYELTSPSFRTIKSFDAYRASLGPGNHWVKGEVARVKCESSDACNTVVQLTVKNLTRIVGMDTLSTALDEMWVREGGRWYFLPTL